MIWIPGLVVALGAAVATAHGLFEVAAAAGVPSALAWLYPLITDGLALVAYAATARLNGGARRYAWTVVVLAAGLSGLAQASYLAGGVGSVAPAPLRFGVGAWPAVAAAVVAHLRTCSSPSPPYSRTPYSQRPLNTRRRAPSSRPRGDRPAPLPVNVHVQPRNAMNSDTANSRPSPGSWTSPRSPEAPQEKRSRPFAAEPQHFTS